MPAPALAGVGFRPAQLRSGGAPFVIRRVPKAGAVGRRKRGWSQRPEATGGLSHPLPAAGGVSPGSHAETQRWELLGERGDGHPQNRPRQGHPTPWSCEKGLGGAGWGAGGREPSSVEETGWRAEEVTPRQAQCADGGTVFLCSGAAARAPHPHRDPSPRPGESRGPVASEGTFTRALLIREPLWGTSHCGATHGAGRKQGRPGHRGRRDAGHPPVGQRGPGAGSSCGPSTPTSRPLPSEKALALPWGPSPCGAEGHLGPVPPPRPRRRKAEFAPPASCTPATM